jgi:mono/diheme cytochrome c family protein
MFKSVICAAGLAVLASSVSAASPDDEFAAGQQEFITACAACHGEAADGNGPISGMFKQRIPDLTGLAQRNDGVFPMLRVIQTIDGRAAVKAHGNPMPVFGHRYEADTMDRTGILGSEAIVRGRVLELALYLQSIQD